LQFGSSTHGWGKRVRHGISGIRIEIGTRWRPFANLAERDSPRGVSELELRLPSRGRQIVKL
jgi:hypothetical protein